MRSQSRRLAGATLRAAAVAVAVIVAVLIATQGVARPLKWELAPAFEGWMRAQYADPSCAPVSTEGIFDVLVIDADGFVCTSSPIRDARSLLPGAQGESFPIRIEIAAGTGGVSVIPLDPSEL